MLVWRVICRANKHSSHFIRDFDLVLKTHRNLFSPNFKLRSHDGEGNIETHEVDTRHYVTGHLEGVADIYLFLKNGCGSH